jgi:hypothetical protein
MLLLKVITVGIQEAIGAICSYRSGDILAIIASERYCSDS